jgi:hypothetical protein
MIFAKMSVRMYERFQYLSTKMAYLTKYRRFFFIERGRFHNQ